MKTHDPRALFFFLNGMWDSLFRPYEDYTEVSGYVHLMGGTERHPRWAVLKPESNRAGVVLWSNCLPMGAKVRSGIPLRYAQRPRKVGELPTTGDPRWLEVTFVPRPPKRFARFRRAA